MARFNLKVEPVLSTICIKHGAIAWTNPSRVACPHCTAYAEPIGQGQWGNHKYNRLCPLCGFFFEAAQLNNRICNECGGNK